MTNRRPPLESMERHNPVPPNVEFVPREGGLQQILAHDHDRADGSRRGTPRHRIAVAAAAAVVLVAGVAAAGALIVDSPRETTQSEPPSATFTLPPLDPGQAVFPPSAGAPATNGSAPMLHFVAYSGPVSSADLLRHLAAQAERQPPAPGSGAYEYVKSRNWFLSSARTTDGTILDQGWTAEIEREQWRDETGAGRLDSLEDGVQQSSILHPDVFPRPRLDADTRSVSELRSRLLAAGSGRTPQQWFSEYRDTWTSQIVSPELQAAYLGVLADQPGIDVLGAVTDRAGRAGIAVATQAGDRKTVLIFDEATGALLGYEEIATGVGVTEFPVPLPSTVSYIVWVAQGYVRAVGDYI